MGPASRPFIRTVCYQERDPLKMAYLQVLGQSISQSINGATCRYLSAAEQSLAEMYGIVSILRAKG